MTGIPIATYLPRFTGILRKTRISMRLSNVLYIFFFLLSAACPARAEIKNIVFTLDEAIAIALRDNCDILWNQEKLRQAALEIDEARSGYFPEVTLGSTATDTRGLYKKDILSYSFSTGVKQYLYQGGKTVNTLKQAGHKSELQEAILEKAVLDTAAKVRKAFYALSLAKELARVNSEILRNTQEHCAAVRARYEKGQASESEVLRFESSLAVYESLSEEALNQKENALVVLKNILYLQVDTEFDIVYNFEYSERQIAIDEAILSALRQRPEIKQYEAQQAVDTKAVAIARADNRPSIYASFDYASRSTTSLTFSPGKGWQDYNTLGLTMSWPIFDGWLTKAKVEQAVSALKQDAILKDKLIMDIAFQVKEAYVSLKTAIAKLAASKKDSEVYADNARILEARYNDGIASQLDMKDASLALLVSGFNHTQALYDCLMAKAELDSAMGAR